jgi:hypothetical protein
MDKNFENFWYLRTVYFYNLRGTVEVFVFGNSWVQISTPKTGYPHSQYFKLGCDRLLLHLSPVILTFCGIYPQLIIMALYQN